MKKRLCALLLLIALLLSGCGQQTEPTEETGPWYRANYHRLDLDELRVIDLCASGDRIWVSGSVDEDSVLVSFALDGTDETSFGKLALPEELREKFPEEIKDLSVTLSILLPGPEGGLFALGFASYDTPDPDDPIYMSDGSTRPSWRWESRQFALCLDRDGEARFVYLLPEDYSYLRPVCDREGTLYLPLSEQESILVIDTAGQVLHRIPVPGSLSQLTRSAEGSVLAALYSTGGMDLCTIDLERGKLDKMLSFQGRLTETLYPGAFGWDLLVNTGSLLYGLNLDGEQGSILTWLNADLDGNTLVCLTEDPESEGLIALFSPSRQLGSAGENGVARIVETDHAPAQDRTVLTLACMGLDDKVADLVLHFNRTDPDFRIQVIDYSGYKDSGYTRLNAEIVSGNGPDLFATRDLPVRTYARAGLLEDLWPWIDGDRELGGREALMLPVFEAMSQGGGLYELSPGFWINTVIGPRELVGEHMGWSMEEFLEAWSKMPEGATIEEPWRTRQSALTTSVCLRLDDFVDRKQAVCRFDSEEFRELVHYTELFPLESKADPSDDRNAYQRVVDRDQMLIDSFLNDFDSVKRETDFLGDQAVYVGLPGASGNGSSFEVLGGLAMSANGTQKEACWRFLRLMLDKEQQLEGAESFGTAFPTNRQAFETMLEREMKVEYETLPDGSFVRDKDGNKIQKARGGRQSGKNGQIVPIYAMTQAQADALMELIDTTTCVRYWDDALMDIVTEEIGAYYAGDRSLDEACARIQKRVTIQLREQA